MEQEHSDLTEKVVVFSWREAERYQLHLIGEIPSWLSESYAEQWSASQRVLRVEKASFLGSFIDHLADQLPSLAEGQSVSSGFGREAQHGDFPIEASAMKWEGELYVFLRDASLEFEMSFEPIQKARLETLRHSGLART